MITRLCVILFIVFTSHISAAQNEFSFGYVYRKDDPAFKISRAYTGLIFKDQKQARDAVLSAVKDVRIQGRAAGIKFSVKEFAVETDIVSTLNNAVSKGTQVLIMDVPLADLIAASKALASQPVLLINARHREVSLRDEHCSKWMFHTLPSQRMLADGLSQFLKKRNWDRILVLKGKTSKDGESSRIFSASARKFGLNIIDIREFTLSNNPVKRGENNVALLTGGKYDVVYLADSQGDFSRYVPFQTYLARPVIGDEGLIASAWHWTFERYGAPQLNQRFFKRVERRMQSGDWAAWAGVSAVVTAIVRTGSTELEKIIKFINSDKFILDGYKGYPSSFRSWNNQLRQPVLLHTHNAVIENTPIDGFLHQRNNLDTLGLDKSESKCKF